MNGGFKIELSDAKSPFLMKKSVYGLPAELLPQEAVIYLRRATTKLLLNMSSDQAYLAYRGWNPFNRDTLVGG